METTLAPNLIADPEFAAAKSSGTWTFVSPRAELEPQSRIETIDDERKLIIEGNGDRQALGCWKGQVKLEPGQWYRASVTVRWRDIEHPHLSIFAQAAQRFLVPAGTNDTNGVQTGKWPPELVLEREFQHESGPYITAEENETFELYLKATANGTVEFSRPSLIRIEPPTPRRARIATVRFGTPQAQLTREAQLGRIREKLEAAGRQKPDIVAITEFAPLCGLPDDYWSCLDNYAESVADGPTCRILSAAARQYGMYVMAGLVERRGPHLINTAVIFGRDGQLVGQYDKTHLTFYELRRGMSCGDSYPVFDLDFGRIAITICYDEWFPEISRYYAHCGAEALFMLGDGGEPTTWRTRAIDNRIYFIASAVTMPSMIIDSTGSILTQAEDDGLAIADIEMNYRQSNAYLDPALSDGIPYIAPQMRHTLDDSLLEKLYGIWRSSPAGHPLHGRGHRRSR